jgi:RimJ/RimL family protein N-acetyltransferase
MQPLATPLGMCGLLKREHLDAPDPGYAYVPEAWGLGFAREAAEAALAQGEEEFGCARILALVSPDNGRSIALSKKLGLAFIEARGTEDEPTHLYARSRPSARAGSIRGQ